MSWPRDPRFCFPRLASAEHLTPIGQKISENCWRIEVFRLPNLAKTEWWRSKTLWPHVTIRLWNGRIAQWNTRIVAVINDYDITGRVRWFSARLR